MKITVIVNGKKTRSEVKCNTIDQLAKSLKINRETVIIKKNNEIAHPDELVKNGDTVEFVGIIYGG